MFCDLETKGSFELILCKRHGTPMDSNVVHLHEYRFRVSGPVPPAYTPAQYMLGRESLLLSAIDLLSCNISMHIAALAFGVRF